MQGYVIDKYDHDCFRGENRRMAMTDTRLKNQMFELKLADADLTDDKQTFVQSGKNILCNAGKHHNDERQYSLQTIDIVLKVVVNLPLT